MKRGRPSEQLIGIASDQRRMGQKMARHPGEFTPPTSTTLSRAPSRSTPCAASASPGVSRSCSAPAPQSVKRSPPRDILLAHDWSGTLASGTHPAFFAEGSGYCFFNDMVIAIMTLRVEGLICRAAISPYRIVRLRGNPAKPTALMHCPTPRYRGASTDQREAPCFTNNRATSSRLQLIARCKGVSPLRSAALIAAPNSSNARAIST